MVRTRWRWKDGPCCSQVVLLQHSSHKVDVKPKEWVSVANSCGREWQRMADSGRKWQEGGCGWVMFTWRLDVAHTRHSSFETSEERDRTLPEISPSTGEWVLRWHKSSYRKGFWFWKNDGKQTGKIGKMWKEIRTDSNIFWNIALFSVAFFLGQRRKPNSISWGKTQIVLSTIPCKVLSSLLCRI